MTGVRKTGLGGDADSRGGTCAASWGCMRAWLGQGRGDGVRERESEESPPSEEDPKWFRELRRRGGGV